MTVMAVGMQSIGRTLRVSRVTFYVGRLPWTRETRMQCTRHFADVLLLGRYAGVCWR